MLVLLRVMAILCAAIAPLAAAQSAPGSGGLTFAARGAWLKPHGIIQGGVGSDELPLDRELSSGTQLGLDAGYRFGNGVTAALFLQYGFVSVNRQARQTACEAFTCDDGRTLKYGVEVLYHFRRDRRLSPFVGAGFGYERTSYHFWSAPISTPLLTVSGVDGTVSYRGWQWLDAQAGVDWALSRNVFLGTFVANSFGRYETVVLDGSGQPASFDIRRKRFHDWLQAGLRLRYDFRPQPLDRRASRSWREPRHEPVQVAARGEDAGAEVE